MSGHGKNFNSKYYCKKHDLLYMEHLHRCPICWGEEMKPAYIKPLAYNIPERVQRVPKRTPQRIAATNSEPVPKRIQPVPRRVQ